jgi:CHAD domain-containing protein
MNRATQELYASIAVALARLGEPRVSDRGVHEARKALKRARAALRLLRPGLEPAAYRAENAMLRDAGRALAPLREPKSLLDALGALRRRDPQLLPAAALERLTQALRGERKRLSRDREGRQAALATCIRLLKRSAARAEQPDFAAIGKKRLAKGMRRIYRKGRRALAAAHETRSPEALHEWRKQSKYLLNALETQYGAPKGKAGKVARRVQRLSDRLGDDHDLDVLAARARSVKTLQLAIAQERARLQKKAFALGEKLYRQKPRRFTSFS